MPPLRPYFTSEATTAAFQLHVHFGWQTHRRQPLLSDVRFRDAVGAALERAADAHEIHVLEVAVEPTIVRALLSLAPRHAPSEVSRIVKGNVAAEIRKLGQSQLWSRGTFLRTVGGRSNDVIRAYIARQAEKHGVRRSSAAPPVHFRGEYDPGNLRSSAHCRFECNLHVVLATRWRRDFLDQAVAAELIEYWRRVCEKKRWILFEAEAMPCHAHLLVGVAPSEKPQDVALSFMNNGAYFLGRRYPAALAESDLTEVWSPSYYVGTVGSATTAQVKSFLHATGLD